MTGDAPYDAEAACHHEMFLVAAGSIHGDRLAKELAQTREYSS
jgi:hypothetical protein